MVQEHWPRHADTVAMTHAVDALGQPPCLLVASYACHDPDAGAPDCDAWAVRAAVQVFPDAAADHSTPSKAGSSHTAVRSGDRGACCRASGAAGGALQAALQTVRGILDDSAAGCKRWTAAAAASADTGAEDGSGAPREVLQAGGSPVTSESVQAGDSRQEWWSWRKELDERLGAAVQVVRELCAGPLQHCLSPAATQCNSQPDDRGDTASSGRPNGRPVEVLLGWDLHCFPWEAIQPFDAHAVFRSLPGACLHSQGPPTGPFSVDMHRALYVVDPAGDLPGTRKRFGPWFRSIDGWHGTCGAPAMQQGQLHGQMHGRDLFVFLGHGAGALTSCMCSSCICLFCVHCITWRWRPVAAHCLLPSDPSSVALQANYTQQLHH